MTTFQVAYDIIGGGEEGDKLRIRSKEEADHSLFYMVAVALLDGEVQPAQYALERIAADDVQDLLPRDQVRAFGDLAHEHDAYIYSGGWVQLEGLRQNIWGNKSIWGRIANPAPAG